MNLSHIIHEWSFGDYYPSIAQPLDMSVEIARTPFTIMQYFLLVVPTTYISSSGKQLETNQYSVTDYKREVDHGKGVPGAWPSARACCATSLMPACFSARHLLQVRPRADPPDAAGADDLVLSLSDPARRRHWRRLDVHRLRPPHDRPARTRGPEAEEGEGPRA
jgi:hypothetical protein